MSDDTAGTRRSFEEAKASVEWPLVTLIRQHSRPYLTYLLIGMVATFGFFFAGMAPPYVISLAFDGIFTPGIEFSIPFVSQSLIPTSSIGQLALIVGLLVGLGLTQVVLKATREWALSAFSLNFQHDLRVEAYDRIQRLETTFFDNHQTGEIMSILNYDVNQLEGFFTGEVNDILQLIAIGSGLIIFMSAINWQLMLVTLTFGPVIFVGNYLFSRIIEVYYDRVHESVGVLNARLQNNIDGIATIKAYVQEEFESDRVDTESAEYMDSNWDAIKLHAMFHPGMSLVTHASIVLTFIVGGYWVIQGPPLFFTEPLTIGGLIAFLMYTERLQWPMQKITTIIGQYKNALACAKRVVGVQQAAMTIDESDDPVALESVEGSVTFEDVTFSYPSREEPAIEGVDVNVEAGTSIGVVGPTGAGKSTLMKLLLRLYDVDNGAIRIDGHDIRDIRLRDLRETIGYISQDPFLFPGTIRENIAYSMDEVTDSEVVEAATLAGADAFIRDLSDGYETNVGERGVTLSGGQRQRIAIARAFLKDPPILVMDEATSHVDNETEVLIQRGIDSLIRDRTAFTIAHRLSTVRDADRILVLDDGNLVETGTHDELLDADGTYANLWHLQVGEFDALSDSFIERAMDLDIDSTP